MNSSWSVDWCSRAEIAGIDCIEIVYDNIPDAVSEAHCVIVTDNRCIGVTMRGQAYKEGLTGFYRCPKSGDLVMFYGGNGAVLHVGQVVSWRKLAMYPCVFLETHSKTSLIVRDHCIVAIIVSVFDVDYKKYDVGEIDGMSVDDTKDVLMVHVFRPDLGGEVVDDIIALIDSL